MLTSRAPKDSQLMLTRLKATRFGNGTNGSTHALICDVEEPVSHFLWRHRSPSLGIDGSCQFLKFLSDNLRIQREILVRAKD